MVRSEFTMGLPARPIEQARFALVFLHRSWQERDLQTHLPI
jgi:hypothetical protein